MRKNEKKKIDRFVPIRLSMYEIDKGKLDIDFIGTHIKNVNCLFYYIYMNYANKCP